MKIYLYSLCTVFLTIAKAQAPYPCVEVPPTYTGTQTGARLSEIYPCPPGDGEMYQYIPNGSMPTLTFNINFVFFKHSTLPTFYGGASDLTLLTWSRNTIDTFNLRLASSGTVTPSRFVLNPGPTVLNPKIKLRLDTIYRPVNDALAIRNSTAEPTNSDYMNYYTTFNTGTSNHVNIYFYDDTLGGNARAFPGQFCLMRIPKGIGQYPGTGVMAGGDLLLHELAHTLAYLSDHYLGDTLPPYLNGNVYTLRPNGIDANPLAGAYTPSDAALDTVNVCVCSNPATKPNNNFMANSFCRKALSARQIAAFHYFVAKGLTKKYTQYNGLTYPYTPTANITPTTLPNFTITGTVTLTSLPDFGILTIQTGANVTIKNALIRTWSSSSVMSRIIVQQGAKLKLECVEITLHPQTGNGWDGIEVWGTPWLPQDIQPNLTSNNQGFLEMIDCKISGAKIAALVGKRVAWPAWAPFDYNSGGGIVLATRTEFVNNLEDVHMLPKPLSIQGGGNDNLSTYSNCKFWSTPAFGNSWSFMANVRVNLENVKGVKFYDNIFQPAITIYGDTTICILGNNSNIFVQKTQSGPGNKFSNGFYGIYMTGGLKNTIEDNEIRTFNGVYIANSNNNKIVRNTFNLTDPLHNYFGNSLRTGIYLNQCSNYKIENNNIYGLSTGNQLTEGMCINNSGPLTNRVYNNTLTNLKQGIWCQNQNYNPNSPSYTGLTLNCNDFTNCRHCIGVQTPFVWMLDTLGCIYPNICTNWQTGFSQFSFNGGIAQTQGLPQGANDQIKTRNTYQNVPVPTISNENKFYVFTPHSEPPQFIHGNFKEPLSGPPKFGIGPQSTYSDVYDVIDTFLVNPSFARSAYCLDISNQPASRPSHLSQLADQDHVVYDLQSAYIGQLDAGDTPGLLEVVNTPPLNASGIKTALLACDFLSDTVMAAYFTPTIVPEAYVKDVFMKNAPVGRKVWKLIQARGLSPTVMGPMEAKQYSKKISARDSLTSLLSVALNDRGYTLMHLAMSFMEDTSVVGVKDSLAALIVLNDQGDVAQQLIQLDLDFNDCTAAATKLSTYTLANTAQQNKYIDFKTLLITAMQDSIGLHSLETNTTALVELQTIAEDYEHPCQLEARNILFALFRSFYPEQKLRPEGGDREEDKDEEERLASQGANARTEEKAKVSLLSDDLSFYPNPSGSEFFINNPTANEYDLQILNINAQLMIENSIKANQVNKTDCASLLNGIYFVTLYKERTLIKTSKLVILK